MIISRISWSGLKLQLAGPTLRVPDLLDLGGTQEFASTTSRVILMMLGPRDHNLRTTAFIVFQFQSLPPTMGLEPLKNRHGAWQILGIQYNISE